MEKPPQGLMPKDIYKSSSNLDRMKSILGAMDRYVEAGKNIPKEWFEELKELNDETLLG